MDNAHEFLLWLYEHCQDGHLTFRMLRKGEAKEKDIPLSQFRKMPDVIEPSFKKAEDEGYDCYFGVALHCEGDGTERTVTDFPALWIDLDNGNGEEDLKNILGSDLPPSAVVETSRGKYHCYWKLKKPADILELHRVKDYVKRLQQKFNGDPRATDAARILRLPGTLNQKPSLKEPFRARVVHQVGDEYDLSDFAKLPEPSNGNGGRKTDPTWKEHAMSGVKQGERNNTIAKLAGQYIQKKLSREECLALLLMANERFDPPLGEKEVERTLDSIIAAHGRNHPANASESNLDFPLGVMGGVAGDFANLYSSYLESPPQFFFMAFLTCLGNVLSQTLCIDTEVEAQPRLYLVLLGQSADDRKSTSISKTVRFFKDAMMSGTFNVCWGIGSAEGLPDVLKSDKRLLLCFDEFKTFVAKSKIEGSVLLPCVNTLFESNRYEGRTKKLGVLIEDAYLSLMAASTVDTYENTWSSQFTDIGFNNRLFLVPGTGERKFAIPKPIPREEVARVAKGLGEILKHTNGNEMRLPISDAALKRYDLWYSTRESSVHARRLETYAMRLMSLLAINELRNRVDEEIVEKVITLCDWQLRVRKVHDPVDADNVVAKMEEKIRRQLRAHRTLTRRNLSRNTHANRDGTWVFETALTNLMDRSKEVGFDKKSNEYYLWNPLG